jgi:hypothetical protein
MIFLLAILLGLQVETKDLGQIKEDNGGIQLSSYILRDSGDDNRVAIVPGDSNWQREEKERIARELSRELAANRSYIRGTSYQKTNGRVEVVSKDPGFYNCVAYSKAMSGINRVLGAGGRYAINSQEPQVGKIGSTKGTPHAVYIEKVEGDKIVVTESNYYRGLITRRVLTKSDFIGFIV